MTFEATVEEWVVTARPPTNPEHGQAAWQIENHGDRWQIWLDGASDARFDYGEILCAGMQGPGEVVLDLALVTRIDCQGVMRLVRLVSLLAERELDVIYQRCSLPVVTQINQVPVLLRHATVTSVFAPFVCARTGEEAVRLVDVTGVEDLAELPRFDDDRGRWTFDELPARFFAFIHQGRWVNPGSRRACADRDPDAAPLLEDER